MVVGGSVERPLLGILRDPNNPHPVVDLSDCPLYPNDFCHLFPILKDFIGRAGLVPYNIAKQKGELKYLLLTESYATKELMLRFVLRSEQKLPLIRRELERLLTKLPRLTVVSVNIQPQHAAVLEGEKEIFLTRQEMLPEYFNQIPLFIRPQGFFQTNPVVAQALYRTAQIWTQELPIKRLWDLFCGAGGFGLHCARALQDKWERPIELIGIEISASAIRAATDSATALGLSNVKFKSLDAANFALNEAAQRPDLVIVNPPRRGIGSSLAAFINEMCPPFLLYSSCNATSMSQDLRYLTRYQPAQIQLFDMFPHTPHYEVLMLLVQRKPSRSRANMF